MNDDDDIPKIDNPEDVPEEHINDIKAGALDDSDENSIQDHLNAFAVLKVKAEMEGVGSGPQGYGDLDFLDDFVHNGEALTLRQKVFVASYLTDLNEHRAMRAAGYSVSRHHGQYTTWNMMNKPVVQAAIRRAMHKRMERMRISADRVLIELGRIAFANMGDYVDWGAHGVTLKDSDTLTSEQRAAVSEVTEIFTPQGGRTVKFKLHDKLKALNDLGRHMALFTDKLQVENTGSAEEKISKARERALNARKNENGDYEAVIYDADG